MSLNIDIGFWPKIPFGPTSEERRFLPEKAKLMDADIAEDKVKLKAALDAAQDHSWKKNNPEEFAIVLAYLNTPERTTQYRGSSQCRVCGRHPNGSQDWFKGPFRYPQGYVHYLVEHGFKPPQQVIDAALGR